jgi:hypothetical protein
MAFFPPVTNGAPEVDLKLLFEALTLNPLTSTEKTTSNHWYYFNQSVTI